MAINLTDPISGTKRALVLAICAAIIVLLTYGEALLGPSIPLAGFFFLPLLVAAAYVPRWTGFLLAVAVSLARERFGPFHWDANGPTRLTLSVVAFSGGVLYAGELVRNRRITLELLRKSQEQARTRSDAEKEARALVETSPAAVLTVDSRGNIAMANAAARRVLGFPQGSPEGGAVEKYIPLLAGLLKSNHAVGTLRTMVEANGYRRGGEPFFSQIWVSSYETASGRRLAAIISDATEQLRDREESGLRQLLSSSRVIASAVSHEMRNLAGAAAVLGHNLSAVPNLASNPDFDALNKVIESLVKLSAADLGEQEEEALEGVDIGELLKELRLIIEPSFHEAHAEVEWEVVEHLQRVHANHSGLLQVFINLAQNSCRALEGTPRGKLRVTAYPLSDLVVIRFADNGPGVAAPDQLFQPFQAGASATGLGLFISRAIIRTFGGELYHTQHAGECRFVVELPAIAGLDAADA